MKLFLFVIGGSGSRVLKALTMLMAAGVKVGDAEAIVPIIIDPDSANGDLNRTVQIIRTYKEVREFMTSPDSSFFAQKISSLDELGDAGYVSDSFLFDIDGVKELLFREFIGYSSMGPGNQALMSLLFSKANLDASMNIGFNGNPNIGSMVLNKFKDTVFFQKFASNFMEGDRIFVISSIFGGTGAAGFPLIVKNIRDARPPVPNHYFLQNAQVGAVTLLPYFSIRKSKEVNNESETFFGKTKAALSYYARNLTGNDSLNALYYIGDRVVNEQAGADGAEKQENKAHFVELAAALAIKDFMDMPSQKLQTINGKAVNPKYYEFGLESETDRITFKEIAQETARIIVRPLVKFCLFSNFMRFEYVKYASKTGEAWANAGANKLNPDAVDSRLVSQLNLFNGFFTDWLREMSLSSVSFLPLDYDRAGIDILNLVNGYPEEKGFLSGVMGNNGMNYYRGMLSKLANSHDHRRSNKKLLALFDDVTGKIIDEKLNLPA